ncbi:cytochrome P450 [Streptomyces sp. NPDC005385]|uniref:cytochrome P450 n=1 Tax=Streptomyces sp. NPDC005385 TaxID=3157039 RepID=UPI0033A228AB
MDAPEHTAHRRLAGALFSRSAAEQVRPVVGRVIEERLDVLVRGTKPADLVTGFADPVAALVITEVLGIRQKDRLSDLSRVLVDRHTSPQTVAQASVEIRARIAEEVRAVENHASDDTLLHRLVGRYQRAGCYDRDQVVELVGSLIIAGHETTASMIALGVLALLSHPDQLGALRADPAGVPSAVEELLRYLSVADLVTTRVTTGPVRLGDAVLPSGAGVVLSGGAANHDPRVFEHPERLDITRDTRGHVAFGYGVHRCIGQHLARVELTSACVRLFERLPHLRLADTDAPARSRERAALHGLASLTVTW